MRAALVVVVLEAVLLVALAFVQYETSEALGRNVNAERTLDPLTDPLVSALRWIEVVLWLAAPLLIGWLVARAEGRKLLAAGLAFGAVASAVVASPLLEQLAASGWMLLDSGQTPPDLYFFAPPGGWSRGYAIPFLILIGVIVGGGLAALEAFLAAGLARRLRRRA